MYRSIGAHIAYSSGIPSAVLFAGPQKHTAIVSSGGIGLNMDTDQLREDRNLGGLEVKKQTAVRAMYSPMLKKTTNITLWTERLWSAPVAKHEEKVVLESINQNLAGNQASSSIISHLRYIPNQQQHTSTGQFGQFCLLYHRACLIRPSPAYQLSNEERKQDT